MGLLMISHDLPLVARHCERVLVLRSGRIVHSDDVERAAIQLGWRAWTQLDDGVRAVLEFVRANSD